MCAGDGLPLPREQDVLARAVAAVARGGAGPPAPLAARQARALPARRRAPRTRRARHRRHVLHARLQRQPELSSHPIAIISELLRRGTVPDTNIKTGNLHR